jgi:hypothetical protein
MNFFRPPSVKLGAAVQEHLHQPHHSRIVDLDAGDFGFAYGYGKGDSLR